MAAVPHDPDSHSTATKTSPQATTNTPNIPNIHNSHPMITRGIVGIVKPKQTSLIESSFAET